MSREMAVISSFVGLRSRVGLASRWRFAARTTRRTSSSVGFPRSAESDQQGGREEALGEAERGEEGCHGGVVVAVVVADAPSNLQGVICVRKKADS